VAATLCKAKTGRCDGRAERFERRELIEIGPEIADSNYDVREGERYCEECAIRRGVL
jgi:hypothetical protein